MEGKTVPKMMIKIKNTVIEHQPKLVVAVMYPLPLLHYYIVNEEILYEHSMYAIVICIEYPRVYYVSYMMVRPLHYCQFFLLTYPADISY